MSHKANPTAIGIFVTGAVVLAALAIILIGSGQWLRSEQKFILYFRADANGLDIGSDVRIGGVPVGRVDSINIRIDPETGTKIIPVIIAIDEEKFSRLSAGGQDSVDLSDKTEQKAMIERGLRGRLKATSLVTGKLFVELDLLPNEEGYLFTGSSAGKFTQIPTVPATMDKLMQGISDSLDKISSLDINGLFESVESLVNTTEGKIEEFDTEAINQSFVGTAEDLRKLVNDPELKTAIKDFNEAMASIKSIAEKIDEKSGPIMKNMDEILVKADTSIKKFDDAADAVTSVFAEESPTAIRLNEAIKEVDRAADSIRELADYLKRNPDSILSGKED